MIKEKYLVFGAKFPAIIIAINMVIINFMMKLMIYEDNTIANVILFTVAISIICLYCSFMLFLSECYRFIKRKLQNFKNKGIENTLDFKRDTDIVKNSTEIELNINIIRETKMRDEEIKLKHMQDVAKQYIIEIFPPYCSNEDIQKLCRGIIDFSNGVSDFSNYPSITPQELKSIDLMHFGWNIYNHFGRKNRDVVLHFLKNIFRETLINVSIDTLDSKLTNDGDKGKIKIKNNLLDKNE